MAAGWIKGFMMNLANRVLKHPNGQELYILAGKPIGDGKKSIYLFNSLSTEPDYSLHVIE